MTNQVVSVSSPQGDRFVSQLLTIPKKDGDHRPIINLKWLNSFIQTEHFKMEGIHLFKSLLQLNNWLAKIDLMDAYFMTLLPRIIASISSFSGWTRSVACH